MAKIELALVLEQKAMVFAIGGDVEGSNQAEDLHQAVQQIAHAINYARLGQPAQLLMFLDVPAGRDAGFAVEPRAEEYMNVATIAKKQLETVLTAMARPEEAFDVDVKHVTGESFSATIICK